MRLKRLAIVIGLITISAVSASAADRLKVVATIPDLGSVAEAIGGDLVEVTVLCPGETDPHFLPAKPSLARAMSKADVLIYNGLELEIGWLPQLITKARNPDIRPGALGNVDCSEAITTLLDVPTIELNRGDGDVHPMGNPHYGLDPLRMIEVVEHLSSRFGAIDPEHAEEYTTRARQYVDQIHKKVEQWREVTAHTQSIPIILYHTSWAYLVDFLQLQVVGEIEHRAGISPSPRHVQRLIDRTKDLPQLIIVTATWDHHHISEEVAQRANGALAVLPAQVGASENSDDYLALLETICHRLAAAATKE